MARSISPATRFLSTGFCREIFGQRDLAALLVQLLEPIEAVPAVSHHLAGLADIAELLGEFEQANLGADNLLIFGHVAERTRVA